MTALEVCGAAGPQTCRVAAALLVASGVRVNGELKLASLVVS